MCFLNYFERKKKRKIREQFIQSKKKIKQTLISILVFVLLLTRSKIQLFSQAHTFRLIFTHYNSVEFVVCGTFDIHAYNVPNVSCDSFLLFSFIST